MNYKKIKVQKEDFYKVEKCIKIKKTFEKYLKFGGFPQFFKQKERDFLYFLFENIIYKDVILRYNIKNQTTIKEICKFLISNVSKPISFSKIKDLFNLSSATTVKEYINYLEEVYLFFTINKFDYSYKKQLVNSKKIYSIDTAFSSYLSFKFSEDLGRQLENIVFLYFKRESKYEIFYHKNSFECDFLLKEKDKIVKAIQVTKTLNYENEKRKIMGLIEAVKKHKLKKGLILTYEDEEKEFIKEGVKIEVRQVWKYLLK